MEKVLYQINTFFYYYYYYYYFYEFYFYYYYYFYDYYYISLIFDLFLGGKLRRCPRQVSECGPERWFRASTVVQRGSVPLQNERVRPGH